jgi:hypothetical protein
VLLVKGGTEGLVRELDALIGVGLAQIVPLIEEQPFEVVGEVTSTFGSEKVDEQVELLVEKLTARLMDSDHVEDVFAEDHVISRDIFRALRSRLQGGLLLEAEEPEDRAPISVRLDTLGYVAATVSKRADDETLRDALERAALMTEGQLTAYDASVRQAFFEVPGDDPDRRLDIEEAVAEELSDLAHAGLVGLPTIERRIALPVSLEPADRAAILPRLEAVAARTLLASGAIASFRLESRAVVVLFTPLSERDSAAVDGIVAAFAEEVAKVAPKAAPDGGAVAEPTFVPAAPEDAAPQTARSGAAKPASKSAAPKPVSKPKPASPRPQAAKKTAAKKSTPKQPASKKVAPKKAPAKKAAPKKPAAKKAAPKSTRQSPPASRR